MKSNDTKPKPFLPCIWIKLPLILIAICLMGLLLVSTTKMVDEQPDLFKFLDFTHANKPIERISLNERLDTTYISSHECVEGSCVFTDICLDTTGLFHYFTSNLSGVIPNLNLIAASQDWENNRKWANARFVIDQPSPIASFSIPKPVLFQKIHAMGNFGHGILQNVYPALALVLNNTHFFNYPTEPAQVVVLNDCHNCGLPSETCVDGEGSFGYSNCGWMKEQMYETFMGTAAIYAKNLFKGKNESLVCFEKAFIGMDEASDMLLHPFQQNYMNVKNFGRELVYKKLGLAPAVFPKGNKQKILVLVYCKHGGLHGSAIANCDYPAKIIDEQLKTQIQAEIEVETINFDRVHNIEDQIRSISRAHVYISDGGSSSYYSLFLRQGAVGLILPQCGFCWCEWHDARLDSARMTPNVTTTLVDITHLVCPRDNCHSGDCGGQSILIRESFAQQLKWAIETVITSTTP